MVLAHALSRAQRYSEAVEVLDRASSALDSDHAELELQLEAAAVLPALNVPVTAPSVALRRERLREPSASDPAVPPEVLASAAFSPSLRTSPPRPAPTSRPERFSPKTAQDPSRTAGHGSRSQRGFRMPRSRFFWPNGMRSCGRCSMPRSRRRG
jgi:hypothetical protein